MIRYSEIYASKDKDLRGKRRDSDSIILFSDLWQSLIQNSDKQTLNESKFTFDHSNRKLYFSITSFFTNVSRIFENTKLTRVSVLNSLPGK